jgi:hypothetical protein
MIQKDRVPQMHASTKTVAFRGIDTIPVEVQVHVANGLPAMAIVGLADKAVAKSRERIRAALRPPKQITINPATADVVKERRGLRPSHRGWRGQGLDLPEGMRARGRLGE